MHERKIWGTIEFENMEAGLGTYVGNGGYVWLDVDEFIYCIIIDSGLWFLKLVNYYFDYLKIYPKYRVNNHEQNLPVQ